MAAVAMPSFSQPRRRRSLFSLGATGHGAIASRSSMRLNHAASSDSSIERSPSWFFQYASVRGGVRNDEVQFTVVPPPTQRPCRIVIDLSLVWRVALSW